MAEFMRNSGAFAWEMEHDASLRSTIVTIVLLDRSPDWALFLDRFDRIGRTIPMFRQRVVETFPPAPPRWEYDPTSTSTTTSAGSTPRSRARSRRC